MHPAIFRQSMWKGWALSRTVKKKSCTTRRWKWQWWEIPRSVWAWGWVHSQHHVFSSSIFFRLFLPQNFSAEMCASGTICWLNLALSGGVSKRRGWQPPWQPLFCPLPSSPERAPVPGTAAASPGEGAAVAGARQQIPLSLPSQKCVQLLLSHVSQCPVFLSWFIGFGEFSLSCLMGKKYFVCPLLCSAVQAHGITDKKSRLCPGIRNNPFFISQEKKSSLCYVLCWSFARSSPPLIQERHSKQLRWFLWNEMTECRAHMQNPFRNSLGIFSGLRCLNTWAKNRQVSQKQHPGKEARKH